jgi:hypothetical protein
LYNAVVIVDVARSISIMTTTLLLTSYKCKRAGDKEVKRTGFLSMVAN